MMKSAALHRKSYSILAFVLICFSGSILLLLRGFNGEAKNKIHPSDPTISAVSLLSHQTEMLNNDQLNRLDAIRSGSLTRENIEIVLSRYNEDISWSDMYSSLRTVYDKSGDTGSLATGTAGKVVKLPNLGRESHTYLQHIVRNYDNLATVTVFSQASQPTHGYMGHRKGGGHLIANSSFHDFVLNPTGHFIFSGAIWLPSLAHLLRSGQ